MLKAIRELVEGYVFDPSFVDVVLWFPDLSWLEFGLSLTTVMAWRWVSDRIEQAVMRRVRGVTWRLLARILAWLAPLLRRSAADHGTAPSNAQTEGAACG